MEIAAAIVKVSICYAPVANRTASCPRPSEPTRSEGIPCHISQVVLWASADKAPASLAAYLNDDTEGLACAARLAPVQCDLPPLVLSLVCSLLAVIWTFCFESPSGMWLLHHLCFRENVQVDFFDAGLVLNERG